MKDEILEELVDELRKENAELRSALREYTTCTIEECNGEDDDDGNPCVGHAAYEDCAKEREELKRRLTYLLKFTSYSETKDFAQDSWAEIASWFHQDGSAK